MPMPALLGAFMGASLSQIASVISKAILVSLGIVAVGNIAKAGYESLTGTSSMGQMISMSTNMMLLMMPLMFMGMIMNTMNMLPSIMIDVVSTTARKKRRIARAQKPRREYEENGWGE